MKTRTRGTGVVVSAVMLLAVLQPGCGFVLQSTKTDMAQGQKVAEQVKHEVGIVDDQPLSSLVKQIGQRILAGYPDQVFDYSFKIIDQAESNAFAAPGGFIYVSRGLLALTNNEDELANVVAHEIVHVGERHTAKQMAKARAPALLTLPGNIVGIVAPGVGDLVNAPIAIFGGGYIAKHSRDHELESDRLGQKLAAAAGYDPRALGTLLARLEQEAELVTGKKHKASFFDTHPTTPKRVGEVNERARELTVSPKPGIAGGRHGYLNRLEELLVGPNPAHGVFVSDKFLHPGLRFSLSFPSKWHFSNTPAAVGAIAPDEKALIVLTIAAENDTPDRVAATIIDKLRRAEGLRPERAESVTVGSLPGYRVTYRQGGRQRSAMELLFVGYEGRVFQILSVDAGDFTATLRSAALSFGPLTEPERRSINETRLKIVTAKAGESLANLSQRTDNHWNLKKTAVVNGIDSAAPLTEGQLIKIALRRPYLTP